MTSLNRDQTFTQMSEEELSKINRYGMEELEYQEEMKLVNIQRES